MALPHAILAKRRTALLPPLLAIIEALRENMEIACESQSAKQNMV